MSAVELQHGARFDPRMATLTTAQRNGLPASDFALPGRRFPIPDAAHARDAKSRAAQLFKSGGLSKAEFGKVNSKADRMLAAIKGMH